LLSEKVKVEIRKILPDFEEWLKSEDARNHMEEIVKRVKVLELLAVTLRLFGSRQVTEGA